MTRLPAWLLLVLAATVLQAKAGWLGHAHAQVISKLELSPGATCLELERVAARVDFWLAGFPVRSDFRVEVRGSHEDPRSMEVVLRDDAGNLTRRGFAPGPERCADLHDAAGLSAALLIKAASGLPAETRAPEDALRSEARAPEPKPSTTVQVKAPYRLAGLVDAGPGLGLGSELAYVLRVQLSLRVLPKLMLEPGLVATGSGAHALGAHGGSYRTRSLVASLAACIELGRSAAWVGDWCLGIWAGRLVATGSAFADTQRVALRSISGSTGLRAVWNASDRLALSAAAQLAVPVQAIEIAVYDRGSDGLTRERLPRLGAALLFGLSYALLPGASGSARAPIPKLPQEVEAGGSAREQKKETPTQGFPSWAHE